MEDTPVIGRFAPTPSGPLHFGSLVTALASYCHAKSRSGQWLLRIEDVDTPRVVKGSSSQILYDLELFGFKWDGEVLFQSERFERYGQVLQQLYEQDYCYACACSRRSLRKAQASHGPLGLIYPGICRTKKLSPSNRSIRLNTRSAGSPGYVDRVYGAISFAVAEQVGDFVLRRADGIYAYHLAVVLDDADQGINQIVRGADLLEATCLQLYLQQILGIKSPDYLHIPLVRNSEGDKMSKQTGARAIDRTQVSKQLIAALQYLNQPVSDHLGDDSPEKILDQAIKNWDHRQISRPQGNIY